jgi:hypothetical protein
MTFEEFEKASSKDLRAHAKGCFDRCFTESMTGDIRAATLLEAQFYMSEMDRRHDSKIARRDFWMEVLVIILILAEIVVGVWEGNDQAGVLSKLNTSAAATAQTMTTLQATTRTMNDAVQQQLGFANAISVEVTSQILQDRMQITNRGQTEIAVWGSHFGKDEPHIELAAKTITAGASAVVLLPNAYVALMKDVQIGSDKTVTVPFQLYVKDHNGEEFTINCILTGDPRFIPLDLKTQSTSIAKQQWSSYVGNGAARMRTR